MAQLSVPAQPSSHEQHPILRADLLRWLYVGRMTLVTGILAGAVYVGFAVQPEVEDLVVTVLFFVALIVTAASFLHTHVRRAEPSESFLYTQIVLDALLVTGIVHVTGGADSGFASLYILVISAGALLLPLPGGVVIGALASVLYFGDLALGYQETFGASVALRIVLFSVVALLTGVLGDRLRRAGQALGAVSSELHQLRLDTVDILDTLSTGVITVDGRGRLAYANLAAEALLQMDLKARLGRVVLAELDGVAPYLGSMLEKAITEGRSISRGHADSGATRLGVSTAVLPREEGAPPSATALFQDITDLERLEELNVRAERLEAVATLSASLAHEIKNPLASIRSAVEQLSAGRLTSEDRGVLERLVLNESDRLSRLLSEFLDYTALRMGTREELDLRALVRGCLLLAGQHPDVERVHVETEAGEEPVPIAGDGDLLHQALFNLVLNGAQSAGPDGRVRVSLLDERGLLGVRGTEIANPVRLVVEDSGPGIGSEERARIFDPFFTTKDGGSGLGLAVVHRAVEAHAGATFVEKSELGGARFVIYLPGLPRSHSPVRQSAVS